MKIAILIDQIDDLIVIAKINFKFVTNGDFMISLLVSGKGVAYLYDYMIAANQRLKFYCNKSLSKVA